MSLKLFKCKKNSIVAVRKRNMRNFSSVLLKASVSKDLQDFKPERIKMYLFITC